MAVEMRCAFYFPRALSIVQIKLELSSRVIQFCLANIHGDLPAGPLSQWLL